MIETPNLDRLAEQGVLFRQYYVNNPICTPSRASIFAGKPLPGHRVYRLHDDLPVSEFPFPKRLQSLHYKTALFGKLHLSSRCCEDVNRHPNDGFNVYEESKSPYLPPSRNNVYLPWLEKYHPEVCANLRASGRSYGHVPEDAHLTRWVSSRTIDFLQRHNARQPFFCYASFFDPHDPYNDYPERFAEYLDEDRLMPTIPAAEENYRINAAMYRAGRYKLNLYFISTTSRVDSPIEACIEGQLFDLETDPLEQQNLWHEPKCGEIRSKLILECMARQNDMDLRYNASRGGEHFPPKSHWSTNNPL